jgi:glucans biosynthesis protein C
MHESQTELVNVNVRAVVRYHYLDNLRALAMFAGVLFHAALAYSPLLENLWFTSSGNTSASIDIVSFFAHLFRMPIFFLVSGFFAIMMIEKRGIGGFIKNRSLRILLPFIIFFPILAIVIMGAIGWAMENVNNLSPMLQFFKMMANNPDAPQATISTMHLWFLFNLFLFVLVTAQLHKFNFFQSKLINNISSIKFILLVLPLVMVPSMYSQFAPHPAADKLYPELWSFGFYGLFFILGCIIFLKQRLLDELEAYKHVLLIVSLIVYGIFYYMLPDSIELDDLAGNAFGGFNPPTNHLYVALCESIVAVYMTLYCLLVGRKLLSKSNKVLKFISDSSYWVYLIHFPLLLIIQFLLVDAHMNMWLSFIISTAATFLVSILSYILFVRWTPIGWLLNGRK